MVNKNFLIRFVFVPFLLTLLYFYFFSHKQSDKSSILLGASLPLSGINSHLGRDIVVGANAYFSHINARGGVHGRKIDFIQYDDKYEPENTLQNTKILIQKDNVFALFGFVGTPTVKRVLPLINYHKIPFIAPYTGASFLRLEESANIVNFRSSYAQELDALVDYLSKKKGVKRFAIFYQNDDYGEEGYIALSQALSKHDLQLFAEGTYKRNTLSIHHAISEIIGAKPEAIILVGAYKPTARFVEKVKENCSSSIIFCPVSFVNASTFVSELKGDTSNILFSQTVPSPNIEQSKEAEEYLKNLSFYYPNEKPSLVSYESYLAAKAVVNALRSIDGKITQSKFLEKLKIQTDVLDGIPLKYRNSQLLNQIYLSYYQDGKFEVVQKYAY